MQNAHDTHSVARESALDLEQTDHAVRETLRQLCGIVGQDMAPVFLSTLTRDLSTTGRALSDAADGAAAPGLRDASHTLAALAATVGDAGLADLARTVNDAAHRGDLSDLPRLRADISRRLAHLLDLISDIAGEAKAP